MEVPLAVLADAANVSREGKLNIFGIFNHLWAVQFPAKHPLAQLVMVFEADAGEAEQKKTIGVLLRDSDGNKILGMEGDLVLPKAKPGQPIRMNHILTLAGIPLPKPDDYVFTIMVGGDTKARVPFGVSQAKSEAPQ